MPHLKNAEKSKPLSSRLITVRITTRARLITILLRCEREEELFPHFPNVQNSIDQDYIER